MEVRDKRGKLMKGNVPWNKGKNGLQVAWNRGLTKETNAIVRKYSLSSALWRKGKRHTQEQKEKISKSLKNRIPWNIGIPTSENVKRKLREKLSGENNPFYGKKHSQITKKKISKSRKGKCCGKENSKYVGFKIDPFKQDIIQSYKNGYSTIYIAKKYGVSSTYLGHYLKQNGIKLRPAFYGFKGNILCADGHKVRSAYEATIDNFLYKNKIKHFTN